MRCSTMNRWQAMTTTIKSDYERRAKVFALCIFFKVSIECNWQPAKKQRFVTCIWGELRNLINKAKLSPSYHAKMAPNATTFVEKIPRQRGRCTSCLCMSWKVFTCIFSHVMLISLVVAYCLFGSYAFERLESENEKNVSQPLHVKMFREKPA